MGVGGWVGGGVGGYEDVCECVDVSVRADEVVINQKTSEMNE